MTTILIPKERKAGEYRVGMTPEGVRALVKDKHTVYIQEDAGVGAGYSNGEYFNAGGKIMDRTDLVAAGLDAKIVIKVKEPIVDPVSRINEVNMFAGKVVFGYFHFSGNQKLRSDCVSANIIAVQYEEIVDKNNELPLLKPMSQIAGRLAIQQGAKCLESASGGKGILLSGLPGVLPAKVLIIGGGVVGQNAAKMAAGWGARVVILDNNISVLQKINDSQPHNVVTRFSTEDAIGEELSDADLVVLAVLLRRQRAPIVITDAQLDLMKKGSVIVDVSIDEGGGAESSAPTTHDNPTYIYKGIVHYCVTNMPGMVGRTSTNALCNATLPYARELAIAYENGRLSKFREKHMHMSGMV